MGGDYADEKEIWLGNEIENYFKRYDKVHPDEIEEYLGAMIENEFDTYFEDGSLQQVSQRFCVAYPLSLTNPDADIFQEMRNKPVSKLPTNIRSEEKSSESTEENEQAACDVMEKLSLVENTEDDGWTVVTKKNNNEIPENTEDDGWTMVKRKHKNK